ncbi:hypothetical protein TNCV_4506541 [Trichonephila clavipes]|nr:hypothetical protein TNCV_4506541 [Trichonephila clavipes]
MTRPVALQYDVNITLTRSSLRCSGRGRGILEVKATHSWPACHKFEPSASEDPSYSEDENEMNNATPVLTSSEMKNIIDTPQFNFDAQFPPQRQASEF